MKNFSLIAIAAATALMLAAATATAVDRSREMQGDGITETLAGQAGADSAETWTAESATVENWPAETR